MDDASLDQLIDDAARSLTAVDASADFRAQVVERIRRGDDRRPIWWWLVPGAVAASFVLALVVVSLVKPPDHASLDSRRPTSPALSPLVVSPAPAQGTPGPAGTVRAVVSRTADDLVVASPTPPEIESIAERPLTIAPVDSDGLPQATTLAVNDLQIEPLVLEGLISQ